MHASATRLESQLAAAVVEPMPVSLPSTLKAAGPTTPKPSYGTIDSQPQNRLFMHLFRQKLAEGLGEDAQEPGYESVHDSISSVIVNP